MWEIVIEHFGHIVKTNTGVSQLSLLYDKDTEEKYRVEISKEPEKGFF